ncbi:MAG: 16S rRNA (guanine(966)-N(2))-methyltransferase RsmD [Gammaproteobacteria bacterium AqS3]|nr:16S rRNA (guanine(966)-N(2))-methyltransferase RsmD [Gammaproteobacteria bacterium AqS3]
MSLRIISGRWRGRRLTVSGPPGLRPTSDRVRETLFNWLAPDIVGARCLDLFCGTGALGLEALSRGAAYCTSVDSDRRCCGRLRQVGQEWGAEGLCVHRRDAIAWLCSAAESDFRCDIAFLDAPFFEADLLLSALTRLPPVLSPGGLVYCESAGDDFTRQQGWNVVRSSRTGAVCFGLLRRATRS